MATVVKATAATDAVAAAVDAAKAKDTAGVVISTDVDVGAAEAVASVETCS